MDRTLQKPSSLEQMAQEIFSLTVMGWRRRVASRQPGGPELSESQYLTVETIANAPGNAAGALRNPGAMALPDYSRIGQDLANANAKPGPGGADQLPQGVGGAGNVVKPKPIKITSLATGVKAEGLAKLLKTAEDQMKEGRFGPALDQYQAAAQLAPNNSMVLLGQANAELAVGFYRKAEQHIRFALRNDPVLLIFPYIMGTYLNGSPSEWQNWGWPLHNLLSQNMGTRKCSAGSANKKGVH